MSRIFRNLLGLVWLLVVGGCASGGGADAAPGVPAPRDAPVVEAPAEADEPLSDPSAVTPPEAVSDSIADLEARLVEMARATRGPEPELDLIKPVGVSWSPDPREGNAFSVRVYERPTGRKAAAIEGEFAGGTVRFGQLGPSDLWVGVGVVPIGSRDPAELRLRIRFDDGSEHVQTVRVAVDATEFRSSNLSVDPRYSSPPADVLARIQRESAMVREMLDTATPEWLLDGPFESPRPMDVTSPFGTARTFNGELRSRHTGLDLRGRTGAEVRSAGTGRVAFAGELYFAGNVVYIDHGLGVYTGYYHLSRIDVQTGDVVRTGQLVGAVGGTGRVTAPHLHWYLAVDGVAADASSLLGMKLPD